MLVSDFPAIEPGEEQGARQFAFEGLREVRPCPLSDSNHGSRVWVFVPFARTSRCLRIHIAAFMADQPAAGRVLPAENVREVRAIATKRRQLVEMRAKGR